MQYMFLIHHDDEALKAAPPTLWGEYAAFNEALGKAGGAPGLRLEHASKGKAVTQRSGQPEMIDGPYADTKEQFAGYFTLDLPDIDSAVQWAARCPSAQYGTVEVRPIWKTR